MNSVKWLVGFHAATILQPLTPSSPHSLPGNGLNLYVTQQFWTTSVSQGNFIASLHQVISHAIRYDRVIGIIRMWAEETSWGATARNGWFELDPSAWWMWEGSQKRVYSCTYQSDSLAVSPDILGSNVDSRTSIFTHIMHTHVRTYIKHTHIYTYYAYNYARRYLHTQ